MPTSKNCDSCVLKIRSECFRITGNWWDPHGGSKKGLAWTKSGTCPTSGILSVFTGHVIKTKNRNHSINKFKNLGHDRWWQHKQPRQELGLCFFNSRVIHRSVDITQIYRYRALYGDAMFVPFWGIQTWRPWCNKNICRWVLLELWHKCFF